MKSHFLDSVDAVVAVHGDRLRDLAGCELTAARIVWDRDDDTWFSDEPVILVFDDVQLEIVFWQLNELALNWNTIDLNAAPNWFGCFGDMNLEWRDCGHPSVTAAIGQRVTDLALVEYYHDTGILKNLPKPADAGNRHAVWLLHALQLRFDGCMLTVFNALDENGLSTARYDCDGFRRTVLGPA